MTKKWMISFAIKGSGFAEVEASTEEEARDKYNKGDFLTDPTCEEWDIDESTYSGGYLDFQEID